MTVATHAALVGAALLFCTRLLRGPSLADRVIAVDGLLIVAMASMCVYCVDSNQTAFIPVVVTLSLVGFVSTAVIARFIEGRGR